MLLVFGCCDDVGFHRFVTLLGAAFLKNAFQGASVRLLVPRSHVLCFGPQPYCACLQCSAENNGVQSGNGILRISSFYAMIQVNILKNRWWYVHPGSWTFMNYMYHVYNISKLLLFVGQKTEQWGLPDVKWLCIPVIPAVNVHLCLWRRRQYIVTNHTFLEQHAAFKGSKRRPTHVVLQYSSAFKLWYISPHSGLKSKHSTIQKKGKRSPSFHSKEGHSL
jgi:hypothetical protein